MYWSLKLVTEPNMEAISLEEAKAQSNIDFADGDDYITALIMAARWVEEYLSRSLLTQTWELGLPCFPAADRIYLPRGPVQSVDSITYTDSARVLHQMTEGDDYLVDTTAELAEVVLPFSHIWPPVVLNTSRPVVIRFTAGYGDNACDVPMAIRLAMKQLVASWYANREAYAVAHTSQAVVSYPYGFEALLATYRLRYSDPFPRY